MHTVKQLHVLNVLISAFLDQPRDKDYQHAEHTRTEKEKHEHYHVEDYCAHSDFTVENQRSYQEHVQCSAHVDEDELGYRVTVETNEVQAVEHHD